MGSHREVRYTIRDIVNNVKKLCVVSGGHWTYPGEHFINYTDA